MTTYRLSYPSGSVVTFDAPEVEAAHCEAEIMLVDWCELDPFETHLLTGSLDRLDDIDGWVHVTSVEVTVGPDEPPCIDSDVHVWEHGIELPDDGGMTCECERCGLRYTIDTWHTDPVTGEPFRWERYELADAHEKEEL